MTRFIQSLLVVLSLVSGCAGRGPCDDVRCAGSLSCDSSDGVCKDPCRNACTATQTCDVASGRCQEREGPPADLCQAVRCESGEACDPADGVCKDPCRNSCSVGQTCNQGTGRCEPMSRCAMASCDSGLLCDEADGLCKDACQNRCAAAQTCNPATGSCQDRDPCRNVVCQGGQRCDMADGTCRNPMAPTLGMVTMDRAGRPLVNTYLTNPYGRYTNPQRMIEARETTQDAYNADGDAAAWGRRWTPAIQLHLALLDGVDGTCGNQRLADLARRTAERYQPLAAILSADALHMDASRSCAYTDVASATAGYLAVELGGAQCGGRHLSADVADRMLGLAIGSPPTSNLDGITQAATKAPAAAFPYLQPAQ